ncbi:hypothetical protein DD829_21485 [Chryseobacterium sp. HMWF035]|nr:hypothetical protein [Chryseobacterium sp. HMWF001]MCQ4142267.1 hypothetical protein [Chryseobacterium sp. EO14]PTT73098.1 hypothetical protein DBR25_13650 [Chryseobacterium sp. HMWF001]PVV50779.1 hypothetical protein DD829_21485 [Chryseobacterium sp. HMWF035]
MLSYTAQTLDKEELLLEESLTSPESQGLTVQQLQAEKTRLQSYTAKNLDHTKEITLKLDEDFLENQEMYANAEPLKKYGVRSVSSGRSSLII